MEVVPDELEGGRRGDIVGQHPHRHRVHRTGQGAVNGSQAPVMGGARVHRPGPAAQHLIGVVVHHRPGGDVLHLQGGGVHGQGLEGGARLPQGVGCVVPAPVGRLLPHAAHNGGHVAGLIVDDGDGRLDGLSAGRGVVQVLPVLVHRLGDGLDLRVQAGEDLQPALGQQEVGRVLGVAAGDEVVPDVVQHLLLIPGVDGAHVGGPLRRVEVQGLGDGLVVLLLADLPLLQHLREHQLLPPLVQVQGGDGLPRLLVHIAVGGVGAVQRGVVGDGDEAGALGQGELAHRLSEVFIGRGAHPLAPAAQEDDIQVVGDGVLLGVVPVELQRLEDLGDLALDGDVVLLGEVLDELLGDGGAALDVLPGEHVQDGGRRALPVHAVVLQEALVLDGDGGFDEILRDLVIVHPDGAGIGGHRGQLPVLAGILVLIVHDAVLAQGVVVQVQRRLGQDDRFDVHRREAGQKGAGGDAHEHQGADHLGHRPARAAPAFFSAAGRALRALCPAHVVLVQS